MKLDDAKTRPPSAGIRRKRDTSASHSRFSLYSAANKEELHYVDVEKVIPFKNQARRHFDPQTLQALADSIKEHGIRAPLTLLKSKEQGFFEVVSGERRLRAAKMAGLKKVPAFIIESEEKAERLALIENVQREDLHPIEFGQACKTLLDKKVCASTQEIADNLGVAKSKIVESIGLLGFPRSIQEHLVNNKITNRELFRRLKRAETLREYEEILGLKESPPFVRRTASLLRFQLVDGIIKVQKSRIKSLSPTERRMLHQQLLEVLKELN